MRERLSRKRDAAHSLSLEEEGQFPWRVFFRNPWHESAQVKHWPQNGSGLPGPNAPTIELSYTHADNSFSSKRHRFPPSSWGARTPGACARSDALDCKQPRRGSVCHAKDQSNLSTLLCRNVGRSYPDGDSNL